MDQREEDQNKLSAHDSHNKLSQRINQIQESREMRKSSKGRQQNPQHYGQGNAQGGAPGVPGAAAGVQRDSGAQQKMSNAMAQQVDPQTGALMAQTAQNANSDRRQVKSMPRGGSSTLGKQNVNDALNNASNPQHFQQAPNSQNQSRPNNLSGSMNGKHDMKNGGTGVGAGQSAQGSSSRLFPNAMNSNNANANSGTAISLSPQRYSKNLTSGLRNPNNMLNRTYNPQSSGQQHHSQLQLQQANQHQPGGGGVGSSRNIGPTTGGPNGSQSLTASSLNMGQGPPGQNPHGQLSQQNLQGNNMQYNSTNNIKMANQNQVQDQANQAHQNPHRQVPDQPQAQGHGQQQSNQGQYMQNQVAHMNNLGPGPYYADQQAADQNQGNDKLSQKNKIEAKNRIVNANQVHKSNNKNLADAQKRIAKIIRDQERHIGAPAGAGQTETLGHQLNDRPAAYQHEGSGNANSKLPSSQQQKSRNAPIQQSKSENMLGNQQSNPFNNQKGPAFNTSLGGSISPKQMLLDQQKKLVQHNSNSQYHTISQVNQAHHLKNQQQPTNSQGSTLSSGSNDLSQNQGHGVNKLRASSGMRNKPSSGAGGHPIPNQPQRQVGRGHALGPPGGQSQPQAASKSQPPAAASHQKIEKAAVPGKRGGNSGQTGGLGQSKSQNELITYRGFIMTVQQQQQYMEMEQEQIDRFINSYHPAKFACKKNGVVSSYAANTHQGIVRNYNEDRVSIILNIIKPKFKTVDDWPRCSFFAVYDGHGGSACADFLRDQLHQLIVRDDNFPKNPKVAIENAIAESERVFLEWAHQQSRPEEEVIERSGTCAIIVLIVGDLCYVANVGDSRAIMSVDGGEKILLLSKDHKPEDEGETKRVEENGGQIYQNKSYVPDPSPDNASGVQMIIGPHRVFPGRLSVSRTIGDIEAKDPRYGGNPKCVIPTPDIKCFKIRNNYDFIILGCDGIFEKLDNKKVINGSWEASRCDFEKDEVLRKNVDQNVLKTGGPISIHQKSGLAVDKILHDCVFDKTLDNITAVMIAFENFENLATVEVNSEKNPQREDYNVMVQRRSLEPVQEEFIESEADTPITFPNLHKEPIREEQPPSQQASPNVGNSNNASKDSQITRPDSQKQKPSSAAAGTPQLAHTQPINLNQSNSQSYNTINATSQQNLSNTQDVREALKQQNRIPSANRQTRNTQPYSERPASGYADDSHLNQSEKLTNLSNQAPSQPYQTIQPNTNMPQIQRHMPSQGGRSESMRSGGAGASQNQQMNNPSSTSNAPGAASAAPQSVIASLTQQGIPQQSTQGNNTGGTPIRGNSGSGRRKIVAQQSHQHIKKQMGIQSNPGTSYRQGTPKTKAGQQQQNMGAGAQNPQMNTIPASAGGRVKSSRQSNRQKQGGEQAQAMGQPGGSNQQRAITPKQAQKLYQSINLNKSSTRGVSNSKISNQMEMGQGGNYTQSMQNLNQRFQTINNAGAGSTNAGVEYPGKNNFGNAHGMSMQNLGGMGGLGQSSKTIPKKDWRDSNQQFQTTQGVKSTKQLHQSHGQQAVNMSNTIPAKARGTQGAVGPSGHPPGHAMLGNSKSFNSVNNAKHKFEKTTNFANLGSLTKNQSSLNASTGLASSISDSNGRYKKKGSEIKRQSSSQVNTSGNQPGPNQMGYSQKQLNMQNQYRLLENALQEGNQRQANQSGPQTHHPNNARGAGMRSSNNTHNQTQKQMKLSSHSSRNQNVGMKNVFSLTAGHAGISQNTANMHQNRL